MGFEIVWTQRAVKTFGDRILYLEEIWTEKEIFNFTARVNDLLQTLKEQPTMFRKSSKFKNTHIGLIIREVSLIYQLKEKTNTIELVAFIANRQKTKSRYS